MSSTEVRSEERSEHGSGGRFALKPYVQMARPDHWFKNIFVLPGAVLAVFFQPSSPGPSRCCP